MFFSKIVCGYFSSPLVGKWSGIERLDAVTKPIRKPVSIEFTRAINQHRLSFECHLEPSEIRQRDAVQAVTDDQKRRTQDSDSALTACVFVCVCVKRRAASDPTREGRLFTSRSTDSLLRLPLCSSLSSHHLWLRWVGRHAVKLRLFFNPQGCW